MNYQSIILEEKNQVAWLTLNRGAVHNAFDDNMIAELLHALAQVRSNNNVRMLILQAQGKNFSAGADLTWMRSMASKNYAENIKDANELARLMQELDELPQPTVALVQGAAFGGAVGLAACCDICLATPTASFCLSEVKIGLIPAVISPYVMRAIGTRQARRFMLTAERFSADVAQQIGLVHSLVDDLEEAVTPVIEQLLGNGPHAVAAAKKLILTLDQQPLNENTRTTTIEAIAAIRVSAEGQEGLSAFLEKRSPDWKTTNK
ncbi:MULTISPECIES: enoyl-CoA hydratase-related protein [Pseudidiomarina]|uniref:Methylglutaconyl-CoA hydratase n=2 Tax=Pseudidiomarina TaxID=2800384 RepID=A0A368V041_9GAMM|nr:MULTISPECIES: enoyl-CoA hydratase-related protein [Pseudidiomarina]PWW14364.1 methylglutaconyl-CoA hydratase [Pseudidiomarina maritima]RBP92636.1 methylglutaconyl-CoA hydratase [Pseudidiomarina tainanensis]RCW34446.1 methylglutaconyl-CoA hydratase [Pseudidiomarina tainanensis]